MEGPRPEGPRIPFMSNAPQSSHACVAPCTTVQVDFAEGDPPARAREVLESLVRARTLVEEHDARVNRADLFKLVTGKSALDSTISATQRIVDALERAQRGVEIEVRSPSARERSTSR